MKIKLVKLLHKILNLFYKNYIKLSYAQDGEDLILRSIFEHKTTKGFYIDIGAHHPKRFSNTYYFYKKGWNGINVDATPGSMHIFKKRRTRDINIETAISSSKQRLTFYMFNEPALNSFSADLSKSRVSNIYHIIKEQKMETQTLLSLLDNYLPKDMTIDFLTVDVEGLDFDVLKSNDWNKYRPNIVICEIIDCLEKIRANNIYKFLKEKGYSLICKTPRSAFFKKLELI